MKAWRRDGKPHPCLTCGEPLSGSAGPYADPPRPGDFTVCIYCGAFLQIGETGFSRVDLCTIDPEVLRALEAAAKETLQHRRRRPGGRRVS